MLFALKPEFTLTSARTAVLRPAEIAQTLEQQQNAQSKPIIAGKVTEISGNSISLDVYGADGSRKEAVLSVNESTKYLKTSFLSPPEKGKTIAEPPKEVAIQKTDIKIGDFISAIFESQIDLNTETVLTPKTINLLPPPQFKSE